jgi:hypothetical protein
MSAGLGYSITALLPTDACVGSGEALLLAIARACPGVDFYDVLREPQGVVPVHVHDGKVERVVSDTAPAHTGQSIVQRPREYFVDFEDHGDVLIPGWNPEDHAFEIEIEGEQRTLASVEEFARIVDDTLAEARDTPDEFDAETVEFYRHLKAALAIALEERLPIVAHW